ncbi:MAG: ABC transporter permease, partial [Rhodobacteraceae bacterium]|nr:ABC transporter permease [Paracoccaceae bacterium]
VSLSSPAFLSPFNIQILLLAISVNAIIAFSQMIIIAIGQMNLSVGAIGGLAAISFGGMMEVWGIPWPIAAMLGLGIGILAGIANGVLCAFTGISAFVITLATLSVFKGINLGITEAQPFYEIPDTVKSLGNDTFLHPLPWLVIPAALAAVLLWSLLFRMPLGRAILAVGGNEHAAELSGISVPIIVVVSHAISGLLAALAGIMLVGRLQIGQPTIGDDWLILSFAAPVIGGAILTGGHVSVAGTFLGVAIVAIITQVLVLFSIDPFLVQVVLGGLILWAVGVNRFREVRAYRRSAAVTR